MTIIELSIHSLIALLEIMTFSSSALRIEQMAYDQIIYHLGCHGIEGHLLPYCTEREIAVVGHAPFGHGNFPTSESPGGRYK